MTLRDLARARPLHRYKSTACIHGNHTQCRKTCKFCAAKCRCRCHRKDTTE